MIPIIPMTKNLRDVSCPSFCAFLAYTVPATDITRQGSTIATRLTVPVMMIAIAVTSLPVVKELIVRAVMHETMAAKTMTGIRVRTFLVPDRMQRSVKGWKRRIFTINCMSFRI